MPDPKRLSVFALAFCLSITLFTRVSAQSEFSFSPDLSYRVEQIMLNKPNDFPNVKPYQISLSEKKNLLDSLYGSRLDHSHDLFAKNTEKVKFVLNPVFRSGIQFGTRFSQHQALGFTLQTNIGKKLTLKVNYAIHEFNRALIDNSRLDSAKIGYSLGQIISTGQNIAFTSVFNGNITYQVNRFLSFQLGKDQHFWGDGYRSLFLSDNAPSFPYFNTTLQIWKIKYTNTVAFLKDDVIGDYPTQYKKFASMHLISWNASKRWNFTFFEAVVWGTNDTVSYRRLDINYLNPFVFYRPQEYTLGSPDNMLMGIGWRYNLFSQSYFYGQFLLDEFYLKEIVAKHKWWANKHALQVGFKSYDLFGIKNLFTQIEYSHARPFTYGHDTPRENYGYLLQPLAHPAGSNFREGLWNLNYTKGKWTFHSFISYLSYGAEPGGKTVGNDIYMSTNDRLKDYGNAIGQGIASKLITEDFNVSRSLHPVWGLIAQIGIHNVNLQSAQNDHYIYFYFGIKTHLYRDEKFL